MSHDAAAAAFPSSRENRAAMRWAIAVGLPQAATPLLIWRLDRATVYALGLTVIAGIYVGFAVADGRAKVIAVESGVAFAFVVVAAVLHGRRLGRRRHHHRRDPPQACTSSDHPDRQSGARPHDVVATSPGDR